MSARRGETHTEYLARRRRERREPDRRAKANDYARLWRLKNLEKTRASYKLSYLKRRGARGRLKTTYGITPEQYDAMRAEQNGLCASCGGAPRPGRPLCVDHCHQTKAVRGLICDACNVCAGHIESHRFEKVMAYLARAKRPGWDVWGNQTDKFTVAA